MTEAEFNAADQSGTGVPPPEITVDNNPAPNIIKSGAGITMATSRTGGRIYLWDGTDAVYLRLDKTNPARTVDGVAIAETKEYSLAVCTQDAAEFAALLDT